MKQLFAILLAGVMSVSLFAGCGSETSGSDGEPSTQDENSVAIFRGVIEEISDTTAVVVPNADQDHILSSGDKVSVDLSVSDEEFAVGDEVVVYYTGEIMESYPLQIDTVEVELSSDFDEQTDPADGNDEAGEPLLPTADIAINIEGVVTAVDGNRVTLDNGKVIIINDNTAFETQNVGETVAVNDKIEVGNFIQGFTLGDAQADEVTADFINMNEPPQIMGSAMVNIEGIITEVSEDGRSFLLDNGKWVVVTEQTELGITGPTAAPREEQFFEDTFRVGNSIAGFTEDENAESLTAYAIYTNWNWDDPIK